jgi:hypothetical protein
MQNHENIEKIKKLRKKIVKELFKLQKEGCDAIKQCDVIKQYCLDNEGHYFVELRKEFDSDFNLNYFHICQCCGFEESKEKK